MKKLIVFVGLMFVASPVFAENTGNTLFHSHSIPNSAFTDEVGTDFNTQRQEFGYGVGADVVVYKSPSKWLDAVEVQGRYDVALRETRVFAVAKIDLWDAIKGEK